MQQSFDFDRAEQLGMIERWQPPRVPGVSTAALKAVLRGIDSYGRGREAWPSEATLARDSGLGLRTVKRAVKGLHALSLVIVSRRGPHTVNHYRIVWTELALLCGERRATNLDRSATVSERSAMVSERSATMALHEVPPWHPKRHRNDIETTTTGADVVVVELKPFLGRAEKAVRLARQRGLSDEVIRERLREWRELPDEPRMPGKLYNWLAMEGSYTGPPKSEPMYGRGDGLTRDEVAAEALRVRIVRAGRAAGVSEEAIEKRLADVGV